MMLAVKAGLGVAAVAGTVASAVWQTVDINGVSVNLTTILQYGPLGIFAAIFVVFAQTAYKRETSRSDRLEAEVARLNSSIQEKFVPALENAAAALKQSSDAMLELQAIRRYQALGGKERDERD